MEAERKVQILIAEDDVVARIVLEDLIINIGGAIAEILKAEDGIAALNFVKVQNFTAEQLRKLLVISDLNMGGTERNGDVLINNLVELGVLPVNIVISSSEDIGKIPNLKKIGITSIPKPINEQELKKWINGRIEALGI